MKEFLKFHQGAKIVINLKIRDRMQERAQHGVGLMWISIFELVIIIHY